MCNVMSPAVNRDKVIRESLSNDELEEKRNIIVAVQKTLVLVR